MPDRAAAFESRNSKARAGNVWKGSTSKRINVVGVNADTED